ncbi:MAG: spore coat U domain-containing protein [Gammaproteobacteria bacterium]|nr:spore coat U domain-containing protein [Gammaproteobacteria bacterium]MDH5731562.1 spore coat U domain-containing protein [Gammaproteobacteria bacterium]
MDRRLFAVPVLASSLLLPLSAQAQVSTTMDIMATVASACTVETTPIDFGIYDGTESSTTGTIAVTCNQGVAYKVGLNSGMHYDGANRAMANSVGDPLLYRLTYIGNDWGDNLVTDTYPADAVDGLGAGSPTTYTVDAQVWSNQPAPPGVYTDTVTVTVAF